MLEVPHVIISLVRCFPAGNSPGRSGRGEEKALMELLFEELICAPERSGFSISNETNYMMFLIPYCSSVYVEAKSVFPEGYSYTEIVNLYQRNLD